MLTIKHYKRPFSCISIEGEKVRMTPGLLARFSKPLADRNINLYAVSHGEFSFSLYVDESETEKAMLAISKAIPTTSFGGVSVRKGLGLVSVTGPELINTPGLYHRLLTPIARARINIFASTSSSNSLLLFFDYGDSKRAYEILNTYIPEKISIFKHAHEAAKGLIKGIIKKR